MLRDQHPLSSSVHRITIALRATGAAFTAERPEPFGTGRSDGPCAQADPRTERPLLIDDGMGLFASTVERMVASGGVEIVLAGLRAGTIRSPWPDATSRPDADTP